MVLTYSHQVPDPTLVVRLRLGAPSWIHPRQMQIERHPMGAQPGDRQLTLTNLAERTCGGGRVHRIPQGR